MAQTGFDLRFAGNLYVSRTAPNETSVEFEPSKFAYRAAMGASPRKGVALPRRKVVRFDAAARVIETTPIIIYPPRDRFLGPRFDQIVTVSFEGYDFELPTLPDAVADCLEVLPEPFYRHAEQGLGLPKVFMPIIKEIERLPAVKHLVISTFQQTSLLGDTLVLSQDSFDNAASFLQRIADRHQRRSLHERHAYARNTLISPLDPRAYPEMVPPYTEDTIFEVLNVVRTSKLKLSTADQTALLKEVGKRADDLSRTAPERLFRLHRDIERVNLDALIAGFCRLLDRVGSAEKHWQKLFVHNPFILSMAFGYPIVAVLREATVGGPQLDGRGAKIADFLVKNPRTSNAALVELKTPQQALLAAKPYRGRSGASPVFPPHPELAGAVAQVLDQRYRLQKDIATLLNNNEGLTLKTYHVDCVVVAGRTPGDQEQSQAFEIYRNSLKDVRIVTFDELLLKLESLRELLATADPPDNDRVDEDDASNMEVHERNLDDN
ncbi:protein of unknown function [Rhizobiales bacterium GAS191]|nr:protein of unknown function [Rhizobiales bacterium GAS191]